LSLKKQCKNRGRLSMAPSVFVPAGGGLCLQGVAQIPAVRYPEL